MTFVELVNSVGAVEVYTSYRRHPVYRVYLAVAMRHRSSLSSLTRRAEKLCFSDLSILTTAAMPPLNRSTADGKFEKMVAQTSENYLGNVAGVKCTSSIEIRRK